MHVYHCSNGNGGIMLLENVIPDNLDKIFNLNSVGLSLEQTWNQYLHILVFIPEKSHAYPWSDN